MTGTKDEIDWSHVAPDFKRMARDEDGDAWFYVDDPFLEGECWWCARGNTASANAFASYKRGTCDWRESLVRRPE